MSISHNCAILKRIVCLLSGTGTHRNYLDLESGLTIFTSLHFRFYEAIGTTTTPPPTPTTSTPRPYPDCGVKLDDTERNIWQASENEENTHPWTAFIYGFDREVDLGLGIDPDLPDACKPTNTTTPTKSTRAQLCVGSIISPRYILTSAVCVACRTVLDTAVVLGESHVDLTNIFAINFVFLEKILTYPTYLRGVGGDLKEHPDIGLLQLESALTFGPKINAICLPSNPNRLYEDETMIVAGWGETRNREFSAKLTEASVKVISNDDCRAWHGYDFLKRYQPYIHQ